MNLNELKEFNISNDLIEKAFNDALYNETGIRKNYIVLNYYELKMNFEFDIDNNIERCVLNMKNFEYKVDGKKEYTEELNLVYCADSDEYAFAY